ncbi:hypothetical protein [Streptomyces sp. NPDC003401]
MAKNKNRDRKQPQSARAQQSAQATLEPQDESDPTRMTSGELTRGKGRGKRFGHN